MALPRTAKLIDYIAGLLGKKQMSTHSTPYPHLSYLTPGQKLGKYEIKRVIGRGGMAEVKRGINPDLNSDVAIKVVHPHVSDAPAAATALPLETQALARVDRLNIVAEFEPPAEP